MNTAEAKTTAGSVWTKLAADTLWVASFTLSWGLLIALSNTLWALLLVPVFVLFLGGLGEFMHQTAHLNLFARSRRANRWLGRIGTALLGVDLDTYRPFHMEHHRSVNTEEDPELFVYQAPVYLEIAKGWQQLSFIRKLWRIPRLLRFFMASLAELGGDKAFVRAVRLFVPIAIATIGWLEGLVWYLIIAKVVVAWYLPLFLLMFLDILLTSSLHYGTPEPERADAQGNVPVEEQYNISWNIQVPAPIGFCLLRRNMHAEHHLLPSIHWSQARDQGAGRLLPWYKYLWMFWRDGPRTLPPT